MKEVKGICERVCDGRMLCRERSLSVVADEYMRQKYEEKYGAGNVE